MIILDETVLDQIIKAFAGVGSRAITRHEARFLMKVGFCLVLAGYKVNTGGANGSDTAFEFGAKTAYDFLAKRLNLPPGEYAHVMRCFLPWAGFSGRPNSSGYLLRNNDIIERAAAVTAPFHPYWLKLPPRAKLLMSRNANQVLGEDLNTPVHFVLGLTSDAAYTARQTSQKTGGTGQAIRIGDHYGVEVFNLNHPPHRQRIEDWVANIANEAITAYDFDPRALVDEALDSHVGFTTRQYGDIVAMASRGEVEIVVQGLSCQCTNGAGLAEQLFKAFPEAKAADHATKKGDAKKLGTYTLAQCTRNGKPVLIINAYTQRYWGRDPEVLYADYEAIRKVFEQIARDFPGRQLTIPRIGAGFANGCWVSIANTIRHACRRLPEPILIDYQAA
jgi:O-acetyl-ADP-ribose deacetylase (regulator of RNase III)